MSPRNVSAMKRQCVAKSKSTGKRCARYPIAGATVCRVHGGATPQVKRSAEKRIAEAKEKMLELLDPALKGLRHALDGDDVNAIIKASIAVLDRSGLGPANKHELTGKDGGPIEMVASQKATQAMFQAMQRELEAAGMPKQKQLEVYRKALEAAKEGHGE